MRKNLLSGVMVIGLLVGIGLLVYPSVANYWNQFHQSRAIMSYSETVDKMSEEDYKKILDSARKYNERLAERGLHFVMSDADRAEYESELNIDGSGIMGYISVPKFHIRVPIYHGTEENVLQIAIGHLESTSLPVGGESTHAQVSGHRGLPSARLFTDLDKIREGDTWTITILNETLTYECDQIRIVEPEDLSELQIVEGEDLCTLITCTPYGINTHRLLVRGHRVPNAQGNADVTADGIQIEPVYIAPVLAVPAIIILLIILLISTRRAKKHDSAAIKRLYMERRDLRKPDSK
ncbi:MAG: class C sortase [Mogibacterium sp.]|nr:class C sortase [Mogibacterium sp.]